MYTPPEWNTGGVYFELKTTSATTQPYYNSLQTTCVNPQNAHLLNQFTQTFINAYIHKCISIRPRMRVLTSLSSDAQLNPIGNDLHVRGGTRINL